jgi:hypothetical protein
MVGVRQRKTEVPEGTEFSPILTNIGPPTIISIVLFSLLAD